MPTNLTDADQIVFEPLLKPLFPKANEILLHTGNILMLPKSTKKIYQNTAEEIAEYITMILQGMRLEMNGKKFQNDKYVQLAPTADGTTTMNSINSDPEQITRDNLKYTVKIFLRCLEPDVLSHLIDTDSILISLSNVHHPVTLHDVLPLWHVVEDYIDKQQILSAGVCDFMLPLLSDLCNSCKHKPSTNQINLGVCCEIPGELNDYAKQNDIQLLTHSDSSDVINETDFRDILRKYAHEMDSNNWKPLSAVRYNCLITNRGVIKSKGFFVYAKRELRLD